MIIRTADEGDVTQVYRLANSIRTDPRNPSPEKIRRGFLVYPLDKDGYQERLNPFFTVAHQDDLVTGFLMCYERDFLLNLVHKSLISHEDGIVEFLTEQKSPFVYGDQIVVDPNFNRGGVGRQLMGNIFERMLHSQIHDFYCATLFDPVNNTASKNFVTGLGLRLVTEVRNQDDFAFGIYHLNLISMFPKRNVPKMIEQIDEFSLP